MQKQANVLTIAVTSTHVHTVAQLWLDIKQTRRVVGGAKQKASHAIRDALPGKVWAEGGSFKPIKGPTHLMEAIEYDVGHREQGAWVWVSEDAQRVLDRILDVGSLW